MLLKPKARIGNVVMPQFDLVINRLADCSAFCAVCVYFVLSFSSLSFFTFLSAC